MSERLNDINCPFCKSEIKDISFLESEKFIAIYNIAPILPGHVLVIPKEHKTSFFDITDKDLFEYIKFSRKVIKVLSKAFNTEAFNWTMQEKAEAGQSIAHMHIHILPRKPEDLPHPGAWYPKLKYNIDNILDGRKRDKLKQDELKVIVEKLRNVAVKVFDV